jgi:hypothetical protein
MRAKAKNQKIVSRAVKAAGFKNIKEAKMALKNEPKKNISSGTCAAADMVGAAPKNVGETLGHTPKESRLRAAVRTVLNDGLLTDDSFAAELREILRQYDLRVYLENLYKQETFANQGNIGWFTVSF